MIKHLLLPAFLAASLSACSDGADVAEASRTIATKSLMDPNSSEASVLAAAEGMTGDIVTDIMAERPFADGVAFYEFLSSRTDEAGREAILKDIFIPLPLNSTPEDDFKIIPGVGDKMAHEFEEYRPYATIADFEREIGKYVDAEEVARLRRYVVVD